MGTTHVQVTIRNPADLSRSWEGRFLVDTGATESVVPASALTGIGIRPRVRREYELADGRRQEFDVAGAELEFGREIVVGMVVFGPEGAEPLLGCTALESAGFEVDPRSQTLKRLPAIPLKAGTPILLDRGAEIGAPDKRGSTPLQAASRNGHTATVALLLDRGAEIGAPDKDGWTGLHLASWNGHTATVALLLDRGAGIGAQAKEGSTPLHLASLKGHAATVALLLDRDAEIGAPDKRGSTPLHLASRNGHAATVGLLLDRDAEIGAPDKRGSTPLQAAARNGHAATVALLRAQGADTPK